MSDTPSRKLAVIMHADVVGSTTLVQKDESVAHDRIQSAFKRLSNTASDYGGIAHEIRGDALVAEFSRASDAVCAALVFQGENDDNNATLGDDICPKIRIGISMGEVVVADGTVTGAGVVLAQRLEQLAEASGVVVQASVAETVPSRMPFEYEDLGPQDLKGFNQAVRASSVRLRAGEQIPGPETVLSHATADPRGDEGDLPALELPDKPSIAVLPFTNMSGDPEQEYFSDGIAEDIITDLSKVSGLFVIARNSSFVFKGQTKDVTQMGRVLGVIYVLDGSVRRAGNRLRINAQLIEAASGKHIWAERYDGDLTDIFSLQDQITENVVAALAVTLTREEQKRALSKETQDLRAYDYVLRGNAYHHRITKKDNLKAQEMFERAIERDPEYAPAYAGLAWVLVHNSNQGWSSDARGTMKTALEYAMTAVALDDSLAKAHMVLGDVYCWTERYDQAVAEGRRAITLDPSYAEGHMAFGYYLFVAGQAEEAVKEMSKALRFNPVHANRIYYEVLSGAHYALKQYEAAVIAGEQAFSLDPNYFSAPICLAAAYAQLEKVDEARKNAAEVLRLNPSFSLRIAKTWPRKNKNDLEHLIDGLRKAGLPE